MGRAHDRLLACGSEVRTLPHAATAPPGVVVAGRVPSQGFPLSAARRGVRQLLSSASSGARIRVGTDRPAPQRRGLEGPGGARGPAWWAVVFQVQKLDET